ncbi:hypothetical protein [Amycolatopsis sp. H20-H5]|uniref:hypothetical protein n=1 Tax=Amycolatopsis sp. H20-H5 TaxID=3046309 RepID=UPI002DB583A8|nr:hypothetical protein [Amycolatopsis sp. H20-H5]MEC3974995.1 hypothetical protein [Amycolatopsis sp. H20-H5]
MTVADRQRVAGLGVPVVNAVNDSSLLRRAATLGAGGRYPPRVDQVVDFPRLREVHERAEAGRASGKTVVRVGDRARRLASLPTLDTILP